MNFRKKSANNLITTNHDLLWQANQFFGNQLKKHFSFRFGLQYCHNIKKKKLSQYPQFCGNRNNPLFCMLLQNFHKFKNSASGVCAVCHFFHVWLCHKMTLRKNCALCCQWLWNLPLISINDVNVRIDFNIAWRKYSLMSKSSTIC